MLILALKRQEAGHGGEQIVRRLGFCQKQIYGCRLAGNLGVSGKTENFYSVMKEQFAGLRTGSRRAVSVQLFFQFI